MKPVLFAALFASSAFAQEIGTEIKPSGPESGTPPSGTSTTYDNPYATPPPPPGTGNVGPAAKQSEPSVMSAGKGAFGVRAVFSDLTSIFAASASAVPGGTFLSPTVGISYWATGNVALLIDAGFGMSLHGASTAFGFGLGLGIEYMARSSTAALRPIFHFSASFAAGSVGASDLGFTLGFGVGGGAAYFFSPSFSVQGLLLVSLPISIPPKGDPGIQLMTMSPTVGATFYF